MEIVVNNKDSKPLISIILVDWSVRESFHSLHYLNNQTFPRSKYEIIWIEFYNRKPKELQTKTDRAKNDLFVDKWVILGHSEETYYHKHFMYNVGIILSDGNIIVICDSDAIFSPTFIQSIHNAFKINSNIVGHLDQIRNINKRFYPFNYPEISEILGKGCINWTGHTTRGLNNSPDILHDANYGTCMCALRKDLIDIGGADEHIDYLGHICGPYEMTFRLVNHGKHEKWLSHELLYHVWHPGESGNKNYGGPHDGRGMSLMALEARKTGRIKPLVENPAIKELGNGTQKTVQELTSILEKQDRTSWKKSMATINLIEPAMLSEENYSGFNIIYYQGLYYGLEQAEGAFDITKVINKEYRKCYCGKSKEEIMEKINSEAFLKIYRIVQKIGRNLKNRKIKDVIKKTLNWIRRSDIQHKIELEKAAVVTLESQFESEMTKIAAEQKQLEKKKV